MKLKTVAATIALSMALAGCARMQAVNNINSAPVAAVAGQTVTADQVRQAIIKGAANKGWQVVESAPGKIVLKVDVRGKHTAKVDVSYNKESYSINYNDSFNLLYNGSSIHRNYNKWITLLNQSIQKELINVTRLSNS